MAIRSYTGGATTRQTPQWMPIPGSGMVPNSAGGYAFAVDAWTRLDRFLVLPDAATDCTEQTEEHLVLHRAAYWLSLKGREPSANSSAVASTCRIICDPTEGFTTKARRTQRKTKEREK